MKSSLSFAFFAFILYLSGCSPRSAYIPVSHNVPVFDTVRKMQTTAFLSANHIELQVATNPVKHIITTINLNFGSGIAVYDAALGWYGYDKRINWHYQVLAGAGYNNNLYLRDLNDKGWFTKTRNGFEVISLYNRFYLQPAISYEDDFGYYDIRYGLSFAARGSYLFFRRFQYKEIDADKTTNPDQPVYVVNKTYKNQALWLLEPALIHTVARGPLSITVQLQAISPYSKSIDVSDTKFSPGLLFSTGLRYTLSGKKKFTGN